jgi:hypothetical protein
MQNSPFGMEKSRSSSRCVLPSRLRSNRNSRQETDLAQSSLSERRSRESSGRGPARSRLEQKPSCANGGAGGNRGNPQVKPRYGYARRFADARKDVRATGHQSQMIHRAVRLAGLHRSAEKLTHRYQRHTAAGIVLPDTQPITRRENHEKSAAGKQIASPAEST